MNHLIYLLRRGLAGVRRRPALHILSFITLTATFLSFAATLTAALNIDRFIDKWLDTAELTVYLEEGATPSDMRRFVDALAKIPEIERVEAVSPALAQKSFAKQMGTYEDMVMSLPSATFPASVDIHLKGTAVDMTARRALSKRIENVSMVKQVDMYDDWFSRLEAISIIGRAAALGFGLLSLIVAMLVVSAVVRASVNARSREIEVLELVGATKRYIRFPFQMEGAVQTVISMGIALLLLHFITNHVQSLLSETLLAIGAGEFIRLGGKAFFFLIASSAVAGILGSRLSLRRAQEV